MITASIVAAVVFFADLLTKWIAFRLIRAEGVPLIPWTLSLTRHLNYGIVANIPVPLPLIVISTVAVLLAVGYAIWQHAEQGRIAFVLPLACIVGGATGNLLDRLFRGYVFDWILLFGQSVINIADIAITVGALFYLVISIRDDQKRRQTIADADVHPQEEEKDFISPFIK